MTAFDFSSLAKDKYVVPKCIHYSHQGGGTYYEQIAPHGHCKRLNFVEPQHFLVSKIPKFLKSGFFCQFLPELKKFCKIQANFFPIWFLQNIKRFFVEWLLKTQHYNLISPTLYVCGFSHCHHLKTSRLYVVTIQLAWIPGGLILTSHSAWYKSLWHTREKPHGIPNKSYFVWFSSF